MDVKAQFPSTDSLRNYNIVWITNNAARAFTNYRLHTLLAGMIDWIDSVRAGEGGTIGIDSIGVLNDSTLRYRKNSVFYTLNLKGVYDSRRKLDTLYKTSDTTIAFRINQLLYTITIPGRVNFVDSVYRKAGQDSIFYRRSGVEYALLDSTGGSATNNANTGAGYRILIPSTQETKTLFSDITGSWDSTSNANGLTYKVDTSVIATLDTTFKILTRAVVVIDTIEYIHSGSSSATYTNSKLINGKLIQLTLENYPVSFITRTGIVYVSAFDDSTGEITLTNGFFADEDHVKIIYRTYAIFLVDGSGNLVTDSNGNYVIVN